MIYTSLPLRVDNHVKIMKGAYEMKRFDDLKEYLQDKNLVSDDIISRFCDRNEIRKDNEKKCNTVLWVLAIIGAIAAVAGIAYAVYRYMTPDYLDDFDDELDDDFEDDFFDDEEDEEPEPAKENEYTTVK
jgi:hypothetical protein